MKTEKIANCCPKCQSPLPADAPKGLCAKCLLVAAATPTEAGQPPGARSVPPPLAAVSAAFPQLEIVELVGHGGMGVIYKARQPRLDRFVALKLLPQALAADPTFAERFNREARVLARLNHPNIVTVHDFGQSGGFFYLLMEFVDGVNLRQAMRAGRFSPQQALVLVPKICDALQFAHDEGVLHRDIKPENILLDTRGRVKIADFGIAKLVGEAREDLTLTASGLAVGTPNYMAPEQLEHPRDVDQRADIYSLGVVFYEMLTGELPIGRFAAPSEKSPVDPRVDQVVFHALEKEREKRFHSAGEVKTSVEAITSHPAATTAAPRPLATPAAAARRSACYFSTPDRMRNCFPGPQAHIFHCKGELSLDGENLTFVSPWQRPFTIPLKEIRDLSIGQFQMWTTPWVMKYARLNFLAVTFGPDNRQRTVHLTPVPPGRAGAAAIDGEVAGWFEAVRQAVAAVAGAAPSVLEPGALSLSAQGSWNRKGIPLALAMVAAWLVLVLKLKPAAVQGGDPVWIVGLAVTALLFLAGLSFTFGFLRANSALKNGNLDAVTSEDPPEEAFGDAAVAAGAPGAASSRAVKRPAWWTLSAWIFVGVGVWALVELLGGLYARPMNPVFSPGLAHLFAGIALLTLSRAWRRAALAALAVASLAGVMIVVMTAFSPARGSVSFPLLDLSIPAVEGPRWAAVGAVLLALGLGWPCYLLMSAAAKALFGFVKPK